MCRTCPCPDKPLFLLCLLILLGLALSLPARAADAGAQPGRLPAAVLSGADSGKVSLSWRLYFAPTPALPESLLLSPAQYDRLNGQLLLALSIEPAPGHYLYAPFAISWASKPDSLGADADLADLIKPPSVSLLDEQGQPLPKIRVFFPPGETKYDPLTEAELPVYGATPLLLLPLPWQSLERRLALDVEALVCSASSCTPFRERLELGLNRDSWTVGLPEPGAADLEQYRAFPSGSAGSNGTSGLPGAEAARGDNLPPEYYSLIFHPSFHQQGLEVAGLGRAVLLGLLAGFILNFMPCVLPVVTLKLGALAGLGGLGSLAENSGSARRSRRRFRTYSLFFSLGVLAWFAALFAVIGLAGLMWGQLFQSQYLVLGLAILLFLLALSLLGVFRLPLLTVSHGQPGQAAARHGLPQQAFVGGILATLLATPCSGPLLGGVLGWAVGQPLFFLGLTLLSVGLGMAAPFILLSLFPGLARWLPKPGAWSRLLEKLMAFLLLGTVIYLLSMLPQEKLILTLCALLLFALGAWLWGIRSGIRRLFANFVLTTGALGLAALACCLAFSLTPAREAHWRDFTPDAFAAELGEKNLLLDFTADWCVNCRALEATTLRAANLARWQEKYDLVYIKVDLTRDNQNGRAGTELLKAMHSASIPLLAIFPAGPGHARPTVLRDMVSTEQVETSLEAALN
jgi:thiol:disulfide interchange protein DsbD